MLPIPIKRTILEGPRGPPSSATRKNEILVSKDVGLTPLHSSTDIKSKEKKWHGSRKS